MRSVSHPIDFINPLLKVFEYSRYKIFKQLEYEFNNLVTYTSTLDTSNIELAVGLPRGLPPWLSEGGGVVLSNSSPSEIGSLSMKVNLRIYCICDQDLRPIVSDSIRVGGTA